MRLEVWLKNETTCKAEGCLQNMNEGLRGAQPAAGAAIKVAFKAPDSQQRPEEDPDPR